MSIPEDDATRHLSADALRLFGAIARREWDLVDTLRTERPDAWQELLSWDLASDEERPIARDPQKALRTAVSRELEAARRHIDLVATMPELSRDLIREYRQVQLRAGGSSVYLADPETVNARLQDVIGDARREVLCAQPAGPRNPAILTVALERDAAALDRGVEIRTVYRDTVRDHPVTADYARAMSTRTAGRRAEYRTLVSSFVRMVIVDREQAFIPNLIVEGAPEHAAWHVQDPAVVAILAEVFESKWRLGDTWHGELRPRTGQSGVDTVSAAGTVGTATSRRQREIMRYLVSGMTQAAVARRIGISKRVLERDIDGLKQLAGADTPMQLAYWWAHCPDRLIDEGAAGTEGDGPCPESAVA